VYADYKPLDTTRAIVDDEAELKNNTEKVPELY